MTPKQICAVSVSLVVALALAGCRSKATVSTSSSNEGPPASSAVPVQSPAEVLHPVSDAELQAALNPSAEQPYSGPVGGVRGVVRVSGPAAPELPAVLAKFRPGKCADARPFYGRTFREGSGRELGDVLVAVTGYKGYVPVVGDARVVTARGCAFESRTVALVFGQRLDVRNLGGETFTPRLIGASQVATIVAVPGGDAVKLFPTRVGQYQLADQTHDFATADVFVLKFPTFAVTGIDGKFDLSGIPAGEVTVSAYLPSIRQTASQRVQVVAGETATLEFTLLFDGGAAEAAGGASGPAAH